MRIDRTVSPYVDTPARLADVVAAIQAMGTYKYYKLPFEGWARRITGTKEAAPHWKKVIEEHPEFFRVSSGEDRASLIWRRNYRRRYHVDLGRELSNEEYDDLTPGEREDRVSRLPLNSSDISTLITAAIELHTRALERKKDDRWWVTPATAVVAAIIGGIIGAVSSGP